MTGVSGSHRLLALDGLRGVAVLLVVLAHTRVAQLETGGAVGVAVFFALSGYLITGLLLREREAKGQIRFGAFYARRVARLLPALLVFLAVFGVLYAALGLGDRYGRDAAGSVFYAANWIELVDHGFTWELSHMWSLAVEEQYYLVWPLLVILAVTRRRVLRVAVAVALVSLALRFALWDGSLEAARRIYFGTDTEAVSLMVGSVLACLPRVRVPGWVGGVAFAGVLVAASWSAVSPPESVIVHPHIWASLCASVLTVVVLAGMPGFLAWSPLRWVGRISYALYLWHFPLAVVAFRQGYGLVGQAVTVVVALGVAWASTRLVEEPIRQWAAARQPRSRAPIRPPGTGRLERPELSGSRRLG